MSRPEGDAPHVMSLTATINRLTPYPSYSLFRAHRAQSRRPSAVTYVSVPDVLISPVSYPVVEPLVHDEIH